MDLRFFLSLAFLLAVLWWLTRKPKPKTGVLVFKETQMPATFELQHNGTYAVSEFVADVNGAPTGDAVLGITAEVTAGADVVEIIDNDLADASTQVKAVGQIGGTASITFTGTDPDGDKVQASADVTIVEGEPILGALVWEKVA